jgi:hypothetical protein
MVSRWEHLASGYTLKAAWKAAWPRRVALSAESAAARYSMIALAVLFVGLSLLVRVVGAGSEAFDDLKVQLGLATYLAAWAYLRRYQVDPRLRIFAIRRCQNRWLDGPDAAAILARRRQRWSALFRERLPEYHRLPEFWTALEFMLVVWFFGLLLTSTMGYPGFLILLPLFGLALARVLAGRVGDSARLRLEKHLCMNCGYSLLELPIRMLWTPTGSEEPVGPEHCPECGCRWPLIPPEPPE